MTPKISDRRILDTKKWKLEPSQTKAFYMQQAKIDSMVAAHEFKSQNLGKSYWQTPFSSTQLRLLPNSETDL